jgi:hypothetical protein
MHLAALAKPMGRCRSDDHLTNLSLDPNPIHSASHQVIDLFSQRHSPQGLTRDGRRSGRVDTIGWRDIRGGGADPGEADVGAVAKLPGVDEEHRDLVVRVAMGWRQVNLASSLVMATIRSASG